MIQVFNDTLCLHTNHTSYLIHILETGHLEHLYYGERIETDRQSVRALYERNAFPIGNSIVYQDAICLENMSLEMSSHGMGDIRDSFIELEYLDGYHTSHFLYDHHSMNIERETYPLPMSYGEDDYLIITLKDQNSDCLLELHYCIYEEDDVITRFSVLKNEGDTVIIHRLMSNCLDFDDTFTLTSFNGAWAREMKRFDHSVHSGLHINRSLTGTSSSRSNPFVMLSYDDTSEDYGEVYGCNLVYSGNHYESIECNSYGKTRFLQGIEPETFSYTLEKDEMFVSPEAIMTYSNEGYNGMSQHMHQFVKNHIVRGEWQFKQRPIVLNSWEACYFDISESKLLKLARTAKQVGIELFVMDDGWFGERNDDTSSLGDWYVNKKKLPGGLSRLSKKIKNLGLDFGIWVEPEMVNTNSHLYRHHPDWVIAHPDHIHKEGRNQRILDLTNNDVVDYLIDTFTEVFNSAEIDYVKWDMNRIFSDYYSPTLTNQKECSYRYVLGLYRLMDTLTSRFPHILFEGCASGGNRFDLGILSYFPQIWASDNTDALYRVNAQTNYSYGYPLSSISAHVSDVPNHQTLRVIDIETRFHVAMFGVLGYECHLNDYSKKDLELIKTQIDLYKSYRQLLQYGDFYRVSQTLHNWCVVSPKQTTAIGMIMQELTQANHPQHTFIARGLNKSSLYHFYNRHLEYNIKEFGGLINTVAPIHIKQDSFMHNTISKFVSMPGEKEDFMVNGSILMKGIRLAPAFGSTGYDENVRFFPDFASRLYIMESKTS